MACCASFLEKHFSLFLFLKKWLFCNREMTACPYQSVTVLQRASFGRGATVGFIIWQPGTREFPAHESTAPFDTGMRELGDLWWSKVTEGSIWEQTHTSPDSSQCFTIWQPVSSPHPHKEKPRQTHTHEHKPSQWHTHWQAMKVTGL